MKIFVKFLFSVIVLVKNNFAMEKQTIVGMANQEQPLIQMPTPKSCSSLLELEAGLLDSDIVIEGNFGINEEVPLKIVVPKISLVRKTRMERRAHFYKEVIFSRGSDCFDLESAGESHRLTYRNWTEQSRFFGSMLNGFTSFETTVELVYFLKLLHNKILWDTSCVAMIKTILNKLDDQLLNSEN